MKKSATSVAFRKAIPSATTVFHGPRSMKATAVVIAVRTRSARKTAK
jgi:hypothetical protein